jgi:hypothetical protein
MSRKPIPRGTTKLTQARSLGYELIPGKARRYRNTRTGETISYNAFRRLATKASAKYDNKINRFETALAGMQDLERAKRESGMSNRQLTAYRRQFETEGRGPASPFEKVGRRWQFRGSQGYTHTFINVHGQIIHATFSGHRLIAMQDYRIAVKDRRQVELDTWEKARLSGVMDDVGRTHYPETQLTKIDAIERRMTKREKARFKADQFYHTAIVEVA